MRSYWKIFLFLSSAVEAFTSISLHRPKKNAGETSAFKSRAPILSDTFSSNQITMYANMPIIEDRFDRWKFFQNLLDDSADDEATNQILFIVLHGFLNAPKINPEDREETGSPERTPALISNLKAAVDMAEDGSLKVMGDNSDETLLEALEALLPDPREEEDANTSVWDIVIEIHGRELVKIMERDATLQWRKLCLVARLLINFDFLSDGLPKITQ